MKALFILIFLPTISFAQVNKTACIKQANSKSDQYVINPSCFDFAKTESSNELFHERPSHNIKAYGWNNIIFIEKEVLKDGKLVTVMGYINGPNTLLSKIESIQISPDGKEIFVLNKLYGDKEILAFNSKHSGNIKPRTIQHPSLFSAKNISIGNDNQLFVLNNNEINIVDSKSNSRSKLAHKKPAIINVIKDDKLKDAKQIYYADENLLVLDEKNSNLIVVDKVNRTIASDISLKESELEAPTHIKFNKKDKSFKVYNKDSFIEFK